ncbi:LysR family transcriptional regulator [Corticibacter populi]|uniref:LysR family transcriptional regulator n=1 Tax=Corticibacter populi TaxID=1550736 RepID=A0A3M6QXI5_9BURK|nr:LysR family transcriptional regulator [Corticibacter populi]RMX07717.1 LysR family transcriptional regulator [Corticibacter populi]RZS30233.1 DNA-binding transcriptional LysR family regulator [Corticibacter populi]
MEHKQLISLTLAIERGSLSAAAALLDVDPSSVSRNIRKLEDEFGIALIERRRHGIAPTEAGKLFVKYHQNYVNETDALRTQIEDLRALRTGYLSIATGEVFVNGLIDHVLRDFTQTYPNIAVELQVADIGMLKDILTNGMADFGLSYNVGYDEELLVAARAPSPIVLLVAPQHPAAHLSAPVELGDIAQYNVGVPQNISALRRLIHEAERAANISLGFSFKTNSLGALVQYVRSGLGVALVPGCAIYGASSGITAMPVASDILSNAEVNLITRRGRKLSASAQIFINAVRRNLERIGADRC